MKVAEKKKHLEVIKLYCSQQKRPPAKKNVETNFIYWSYLENAKITIIKMFLV